MYNELHPLKFKPQYKEKIWGGQKLNTVFEKNFSPLTNCGESWEISGVPGNVSVVSQGLLKGENLNSLIENYQDKLVGRQVYKQFKNEFPLLIKFIDAADDLSIQVHPDDALAAARHNCKGKTEMWYILQADQGARLISGFNRKLDRETCQHYLNEGNLGKILNFENVSRGDLFYLPAGRVHAICRGILLAEIQQTSDITYRIYDWDRKDANGRGRKLHTEQALEAMDYYYYSEYKTPYQEKNNQTILLKRGPYFETFLTAADRAVVRDYKPVDSFVILIAVSGSALLETELGNEHLQAGQTLLLPAMTRQLKIFPDKNVKLLETRIPAQSLET